MYIFNMKRLTKLLKYKIQNTYIHIIWMPHICGACTHRSSRGCRIYAALEAKELNDLERRGKSQIQGHQQMTPSKTNNFVSVIFNHKTLMKSKSRGNFKIGHPVYKISYTVNIVYRKKHKICVLSAITFISNIFCYIKFIKIILKTTIFEFFSVLTLKLTSSIGMVIFVICALYIYIIINVV